jgi:hypothetical protein
MVKVGQIWKPINFEEWLIITEVNDDIIRFKWSHEGNKITSRPRPIFEYSLENYYHRWDLKEVELILKKYE